MYCSLPDARIVPGTATCRYNPSRRCLQQHLCTGVGCWGTAQLVGSLRPICIHLCWRGATSPSHGMPPKVLTVLPGPRCPSFALRCLPKAALVYRSYKLLRGYEDKKFSCLCCDPSCSALGVNACNLCSTMHPLVVAWLVHSINTGKTCSNASTWLKISSIIGQEMIMLQCSCALVQWRQQINVEGTRHARIQLVMIV